MRYKQTKRKKTCIYAATSFYVQGKDYPVYVDEAGKEYTKGRDGMYDLVGKTSSKFVDKVVGTSVVNTRYAVMKIEVGKYYKTAKGKTAYVETFEGGKDGYHVDHGNGVYVWHFESGKSNLSPILTDYDLLVEWEQEPKVDYNNGEWHGWNGGECPVHSRSFVDCVWMYKDGVTILHQKEPAGHILFQENDYGDLISFRVVEPYVEPKEPREWDVVVTEDDNLITTYMPETLRKQGREVIRVREVLE